MDAEAFFPILVWCFVHCDAANLPSAVKYCEKYTTQTPSITRKKYSEVSYYLTSMMGAVQWICSMVEGSKAKEELKRRQKTIEASRTQRSDSIMRKMSTLMHGEDGDSGLLLDSPFDSMSSAASTPSPCSRRGGLRSHSHHDNGSTATTATGFIINPSTDHSSVTGSSSSSSSSRGDASATPTTRSRSRNHSKTEKSGSGRRRISAKAGNGHSDSHSPQTTTPDHLWEASSSVGPPSPLVGEEADHGGSPVQVESADAARQQWPAALNTLPLGTTGSTDGGNSGRDDKHNNNDNRSSSSSSSSSSSNSNNSSNNNNNHDNNNSNNKDVTEPEAATAMSPSAAARLRDAARKRSQDIERATEPACSASESRAARWRRKDASAAPRGEGGGDGSAPSSSAPSANNSAPSSVQPSPAGTPTRASSKARKSAARSEVEGLLARALAGSDAALLVTALERVLAECMEANKKVNKKLFASINAKAAELGGADARIGALVGKLGGVGKDKDKDRQ
jgi:hypothetical protein